MSEIELTQTQRGFDRINFTDYDGIKCHLQKSSLATEDCIRFGCSELGLIHFVPGNGWKPVLNVPPQTIGNTTMHLTKDMVGELLPYLQEFYLSGELISPDYDHDAVNNVIQEAVDAAQEINALKTQLADAQAEIKRLREALEKYSKMRNVNHHVSLCGGDFMQYEDGECGLHSSHIARQALEQENQQ